MLQWMGGSRRKVTTSRKSTQNRQKQYFEQKRRQQQQTFGYDSNVDAANPCGQYHQKSKSLDILTLQNLEAAVHDCKSSLTNEAEERAEINASSVKCLIPNCPPPSLRSGLLPKYATAQKEAKTNPLGYEAEHTSPKKAAACAPVEIQSSCGHSSKRNSEVLDNHKSETEHQVSVLDLLGDDGSNENSEGSEVHEAHVAFSIQGLGKMGAGTPLHSPRRPGSRLLTPKPLRRHKSSKSDGYMNDLEFELNSIIHGIDMPSCDNPLGIPIDTRSMNDCFILPKKGRSSAEGGIPQNSQFQHRDIFFDEEENHCINMENGTHWKAGPGFVDESFSGESTHHAGWKNRSYNDSANFLRDETDDESDFTFEDSSWTNRRDAVEEQREFNILELPASYLKDCTLENDHDFINSDAKRYPGVRVGWDYSPPTWSPFATDANEKETMSFLSESSATSSAGSLKAKCFAPTSVLGKSPRKYESDLHRNNVKVYSAMDTMDIYAEGTLHRNGAKGFGKYAKVADPSRAELFNMLNNPVRLPDSCCKYSWLFEEDFTSDSCFNSFQRTNAESELATECKHSFEGPCLASPYPSLYYNSRSSCKRSKHNAHVKHAPCCSTLFSEESPSPQPFNPLQYYDSPSFVDIVSNSRKPAISQASRMQVEPSHSNSVSQGDMNCPALSGQGEFPEGGKEESGNQPSGCGSSPEELEKEFTVVDNELLSENGKPMDASCSKGNVQSIEAENETPEHGDQPRTRDSSEHVEEISSAKKEVPGELERFLNDIRYKFNGHMHFPDQDGKVEKDNSRSEKTSSASNGNDSKNPSYQVMLESYVLQLLCVQKVLREASEQDSAKKV